jgi:hypothetical protein
MLLVGVLSLLPTHFKNAIGTTGILHPWGHIGLFAVALVVRWPRSAPLILRAVLLACFGFCLEFGQHTLFRNRFEWRDVGLDAFGVTIGIVVYLRQRLRFS